MRTISFEAQAFKDLEYWRTVNPKAILKIIELISDIQKHPFSGLGKPEPLKNQLKGFWSRRITDEHRLVYSVNNTTVYIAACRYHYE